MIMGVFPSKSQSVIKTKASAVDPDPWVEAAQAELNLDDPDSTATIVLPRNPPHRDGSRECQPVSPSGGIKHDAGKSPVELLPTSPLLAIADVLGFGAKKYAAHNWRGGFAWSRLIGAAQRHILAFNDGEDKDPESGLSHLAHAGCCILFLLEHEAKQLGTDDRFKS